MRDIQEYTGELFDSISESHFSVTISYHFNDGDVSIEEYELEGDSVSRDELVERFGEYAVNTLEGELN